MIDGIRCSVDKRTCTAFVPMPPEPVFCTENESNPLHPEYGVATIPFPISHDQYAYCMELLEALKIGDAVKADCKVEEIDSFFTVLKRMEMLTVRAYYQSE